MLSQADVANTHGSHFNLLEAGEGGTLVRMPERDNDGKLVDPLYKTGDTVKMKLDSDTGVFTW